MRWLVLRWKAVELRAVVLDVSSAASKNFSVRLWLPVETWVKL
ncbi:hypothetical protein ACQ86N_31060 [Puia sp. P3]